MVRPVVKKKTGISPIWILPIIALCIGGWLLYKGIRDAGVKIVVHFENGSGVTAGKTRVMYKGIPVGMVKDMKVDKGLNSVSLIIEMERQTKSKLVEDTRFWMVKPEVSAGRVSGLETLFSGIYIGVEPGTSSVKRRDFIGLPHPPVVPEHAPGLHIKLRADALRSLQKGSRIY